MSQENVEIVRRLYSLAPEAAGVLRGDYDGSGSTTSTRLQAGAALGLS